MSELDAEAIIARTREWIEKAVIGLKLCPFAKPVFDADRIRYVVSAAQDEEALLTDLERELLTLSAADPTLVETTLIIHARVLADFLEYNDFLDAAESVLTALDLEDDVQIASFHPHYQFEGSKPDDITNFTNRSPFPMLHLLREASVDRAVDAYPNTEEIFERNMETLRALGIEGWRRLFLND